MGRSQSRLPTAYGYHIVKRLHQRDIPADKTDEVFVAALKTTGFTRQ
jgi:hypothetical protein